MDGNSRTLLIVNPIAGHGRGKKIFARIEPRVREVFPELDVRISEFPGHAFQLGREAARERYSRVLCLGGDGTPFEVINGLYIHGRPSFVPEMGLIPAGTGNSFLRDFGIETPEEAVRRFAAGRRLKVDLIEFEFQLGGKTERRYSLNIIGAGLITDILKLTNDWLKIFGKLGYSLAVLIRLARGMDNTIDIEAGGQTWSIQDSALVVSNSQFTGGRMKIAPHAATADGKADLVVFRDVNRREILQIFKRVFSGSHASHPKVEITQAAEMAITGRPPLRVMADGEVLGESPLRIKVLPQELTFLG
ncbi:MAG: diacylglycerol kinase family lipid kinase [Candidatus Aminicenantes bacterium]|nr:diacylglycerol kinase family lipid kinase [Candidatus Aminicenantes bacterium]